MVQICILGSSSAGNSVFVRSGSTRLLIDAGLSRREIAGRLAAIGEDVADLDAVLVTHEHSDHVCGLLAVARHKRKQPIPVFVSHGTAECVDWGECPPPVERFQAGCSFSVGPFDVRSFTIPHDAADPVGFTLTAEGIKLSLATDLGYVPDSLRVHLQGTDLLILEANHDLEMLRVGPYPWSVKQRVMSRRGHLSNEVAAQFIRDDLDTAVSTIVLAHISEHNNHPELVRSTGARALQGRALFTRLIVAEPGVQSEVFSY
ncbi:MAG: MBL fold metallo-hydrolase [Rhodospirillales bacterium]|nr:MBL fold metallo-hydrolase [Acetobacter sp.]